MDKFATQRQRLGDEIQRYADMQNGQSKSVSITLRYPLYSDLTQDQLAYYTYWKSTVGTKSFRKAADGYCWLFICELLNGPDKVSAGKKLNDMVSGPYPELLDTAIEFSRFFGTPMPAYSEEIANQPSVVPLLLQSPVSDLPEQFISKYIPDAKGNRTLTDAVNRILRKYDAVLSEKGCSVRDIAMDYEKQARLPFGNYVLLGPKQPIETIIWHMKDNGLFDTLLGYIADTYLSGKESMIDVPCLPELNRIIASVRSGLISSSPIDPFGKEPIGFRKLGTPCGTYGPSCLCDILSSDRSGKRITLGDILTFGPPEQAKPAPFVTSDLEHPTYDDLSRAQFAYYTYWKNSFRSGRHLDTDCGYLNLFITELINSNDRDSVRVTLEKLAEVYGNIGLLPVTLTDHAICNGYDVPDIRTYADKMTVSMWIDSFVTGSSKAPLDIMVLNLMRTGNANVKFVGQEITLEPFERCLRRIFREISRKKDLYDTLSVEELTVRRSIYFGLEYLRGPKETLVRYRNYLGSRKFTGFVDKAFRYASEVELAHNGGTQSKRKAFTFGGINCADVIEEEYLIWWSVSERPAEIKLELDTDAINAAASDLAEVTEMMRVEEEPEEEIPEEIVTIQNEKEGDPWQTFRSSLDENESKYLRLCLEGTNPAPFLKEAKLTRIKIEDSINSKALDSVGDTVIENGEPIEDYLDELERL